MSQECAIIMKVIDNYAPSAPLETRFLYRKAMAEMLKRRRESCDGRPLNPIHARWLVEFNKELHAELRKEVKDSEPFVSHYQHLDLD